VEPAKLARSAGNAAESELWQNRAKSFWATPSCVAGILHNHAATQKRVACRSAKIRALQLPPD
jgi:hypothetical protein